MTRGALVLCGGRSTRMGRDKAHLPFGDEALLQRVVRIVGAVVDEVVVVGRRDQELPPLDASVRIAHDDIDDQGPLVGLLAGLGATDADAVYATACDVPFLQPAFVEHLFARLADHDVAVAEAEGFTQPLAAVYRAGVASVLERLFAEGKRRPIFLYDSVDTLRIREDELRTVDSELLSLRNVNTREAYAEALRLLDAEDER